MTIEQYRHSAPETFFLVMRKPDDPISGARPPGQPLFFFFSTSPLEVDAGKFSFYQFSKIMNFDDFLKRVSIAEAKQIYPNSFFETEARITNYKRLLTTAELDYLGKILENYDRLACSDKKIVDRSGKEHNLVTANLTKQIPQTETSKGRRYTRGEFVLSDNGTILIGRFLIGGPESLRLRKIQETLDKNYGSNGRER